jgi:hypothetical protein
VLDKETRILVSTKVCPKGKELMMMFFPKNEIKSFLDYTL